MLQAASSSTALEGKTSATQTSAEFDFIILLAGAALGAVIAIIAILGLVDLFGNNTKQPLKAAAFGKDAEIVRPQCGPQIPEAGTPGGVVALFEKQVRQNPDALALLEADSSTMVTYSELSKSVDALALALQGLGVQKGDVVGLLLQPSRSFVVATLAVMKVGAAWLPLDVKSPGSRLQKLLHRANACVALTDGGHVDSLGGFPTCSLSSAGSLAATSVKALQRDASLQDVAVIFYTSGSSGEPKAVMYGPDTLCHGALTMGKLCQVDASSVFLIKTPTIWAVTEYEVFTPLIYGATAVVSAESQRDIEKLTQSIKDHKVSVLVTSGPVLQLLVDESFPSLRHAVNVGAALPLDVCTAVQAAFGSSVSLHNMYGCTESPCLTWTFTSAPAGPWKKVAPAGIPQPGAEVQVMDDKCNLVSLGTLGEIFIGGPFLSKGYLGDKSHTDERFIVNPHGTGRLYRTGDAGRWVQDAEGGFVLQVEGRTDRQFNMKGVRVSPEEVEAVLSQVPGVKEIAVVAAGGESGERMAAAIAGVGPDLAASVQKHGEEHLPSHMRPTVLLLVDKLPRLGNGKIDLVSTAKIASEQVTANDSTQSGEVEVLDSLGKMRQVKRHAALELQVISALRGWASLFILLYHVSAGFTGGWGGIPMDSSMFLSIASGFRDSCWAVPMFIMMSAYVDSKEAPKSKLLENIMSIILSLLCISVLPLMTTYWLYGDYAFALDGPRWYLQYFILCNLLHTRVFLPVREHLKGILAAEFVKIVIILVVARLSTLLHHINVCGVGSNVELTMKVLAGGYCYFVPFSADDATNSVSIFGLVQTGSDSTRTWLFPLYAMVWWYGPDVVTHLQKYSLPPALSALLATLLLFQMAHWAGCDAWWNPSAPAFTGVAFRLWGILFALVTVLTMALASRLEWFTRFPLRILDFLGKCALGTFMFHWFIKEFIPSPNHVLYAVGTWPGSAFLKLGLLVAYLAVWAAAAGSFCQFCIINGAIYLSKKLTQMVELAMHKAASSPHTEQEESKSSQGWERWKQVNTVCFNVGGVLCIDGGTGSEVQREAEKLGSKDEAVNSDGWSCVQWKTHPDVLRGVHLSYLRSGAHLVISNSYATNRHIMKAAGYEELTCQATLRAVGLACEARNAFDEEEGLRPLPNLVAGSMSCHPPGMAHGANMDDGKWPAPEIEAEGYVEQARLVRDAGADVIFVEMVWEWKAHGIKAVRGACASGLPVIVCFTVFNAPSCEDNMPQLHDGTLVEEIAEELSTGAGWSNVVGICVHHTKLPLVLPCLEAIRRGGWKGVVGAYPDHGTFEMPHWRFEPLEANKILDYISQWVETANCQMVGGCCGIGPETIGLVSKWCQKFNAGKGCACSPPNCEPCADPIPSCEAQEVTASVDKEAKHKQSSESSGEQKHEEAKKSSDVLVIDKRAI
eukprot:TRINITY_DN31986_c0_g1_i1.p1 TRINITY_DN31986_c0_g1~~TRINITY_DN31986_c0_g1_i1.p1  ORF type:complete len:1485 (-),score=283.50 TRINITY_DN31986_c0_g1_i1:151-4404(-)